MAISAGTRLGPYEILAPLGAGGMGEVYRAKDSRLGREVAIKVLPAELSRDADRIRRFEKEARAASALTHPNIVTIHDMMESGSGLCIVMELVSGRTLRELLGEGALAPGKWLGIATQTAEGLARAHAGGIVHRDLKPENLMVTDDGFVKILDFGLAKLTQPAEESGATQSPTVSRGTEPGLVMGTVGYMSPEQALGKTLDFRSDQFSLGSIVYEMATGRRAFARASTPETLSAIIREEPESLGSVAPSTPAPARWIVERCLAKEAPKRYASTEDLARDLASVRDHLSELSVAAPGPAAAPGRRPRIGRALALGAALALAAAAGVLGGRRMVSTTLPSFTPLTFRRGSIQAARFAPDGQSVVYSAAWDGKPAMLFLKRPDSPDEVPISLPSANILSISKTGEMAIALDCRGSHQGVCRGALAQAPITGGAPRPIADDAQQADWAPDGSLVVARDVGGRGRVEFPVGKVLFETVGHVSFPRISPRADRIAFIDHPLKVDNRGSVAVVDLAGHKRTLTREWTGIEGLAWSPSGEEIWFTAASVGGAPSSLYAVSLKGRERLLARLPEGFRIHDVSRSGRVLMTLDSARVAMVGRIAGESRDRDLSWLNWSNARDVSRDGKTLLFDEEGVAAGPNYATCIRGMDGSPVVRLGEGAALALSPSGGWAVAQLSNPTESPLMLLATRTGEHRLLPTGGMSADEVEWLDEKRIVLTASSAGHPSLLYVQDVGRGEPRAISTENVEANYSDRIAPSPDGRFVAAVGPEHKCRLYPVAGGASRIVAGMAPGEFPVRWSEDGRWLYIRGAEDTEPPVRLFRVEPETGRREAWTELMPADPAGLSSIGSVALAPDGKSYAYSYGTNLSQLVVADGIR